MLSAEVLSWDIESLNLKPIEAIIATKREGEEIGRRQTQRSISEEAIGKQP